MDRLEVLVRILRSDRRAAAAARHPENVGKLSVASDVRADDAMLTLVAMLQDRSARAVAEEGAGVAVGPVRNRSQLFRADHEHRFVGVGGDELLGDLDRKK